jgi:hypothetical protein
MTNPPRPTLVRGAVATFLPLAVLGTLLAGLVFGVAQQGLRSGANDPQLQLAEDAARALDDGGDPAAVVGPGKVDVAVSLAPFAVVFDAAGRAVASSGVLDGADPVPPPGVLAYAAADVPNIVTWQPREGVRVATVTARWRDGTVMAGRSLREVERRVDQALLLVGVGWAVTMAAAAFASLVAEVVRRR